MSILHTTVLYINHRNIRVINQVLWTAFLANHDKLLCRDLHVMNCYDIPFGHQQTPESLDGLASGYGMLWITVSSLSMPMASASPGGSLTEDPLDSGPSISMVSNLGDPFDESQPGNHWDI